MCGVARTNTPIKDYSDQLIRRNGNPAEVANPFSQSRHDVDDRRSRRRQEGPLRSLPTADIL